LIDVRQGATLIQVFTFQSALGGCEACSNGVITVYPTDQRTIQSRRSGGRWRTTRHRVWPTSCAACAEPVDPATGAILFRHNTLVGIPDRVVEGDGYTLEFIGPTLLCLDISRPGPWDICSLNRSKISCP
jgi:hypothetical protein